MNRVLEVDSLDESGLNPVKTTTQYQGFVTTLTNAKLQKRVDTRNIAGQLAQVQDANLGLTVFGHEPFGNLNSTKDPNGNVIGISYDRLGRKTDLNDPDLGHIQYMIDPIGQVWAQISPNQRAAAAASVTSTVPQQTSNVYDLLGRQTARYETDLESHWQYDTANYGVGKLAQAYTIIKTQNIGKQDYVRQQTYDKLSRPLGTSIAAYNGSYTSTTGYDGFGRVSSTSDTWTPTGATTGTAIAKAYGQFYNQYGYLAQVVRLTPGTCATTNINTCPAKVLWQATKQDAADRVIQATLGNGLTVSRGYDNYTATLQSVELGTTSYLTLSESYAYDNLKNVLTRTEYWHGGQSGYSELFSYDNLNRLSTSSVTTSISATVQAQILLMTPQATSPAKPESAPLPVARRAARTCTPIRRKTGHYPRDGGVGSGEALVDAAR